ncbi:Uncharacterised protein [Mycoplasmopsis edwardii]|uniref:Uncharacterized protein n=1 Tax=Mycoplasmopsis edwardii TaxID=53558 RepID=A0A3B0PKZ8_9BACT|nr:Uncharacterised protein [Mycoplasmopsis edwardii]
MYHLTISLVSVSLFDRFSGFFSSKEYINEELGSLRLISSPRPKSSSSL